MLLTELITIKNKANNIKCTQTLTLILILNLNINKT